MVAISNKSKQEEKKEDSNKWVRLSPSPGIYVYKLI